MQKLFIDKLHFFRFLFSEWQSTTAPAKNYHFFLKYNRSFLDCLNIFIRTGKCHQERGNTLCWEQMQSSTNLSSTLKLFISWCHLYFANFRTKPTEMVLHRGTPGTWKSTNRVSSISFCWESAFWYAVVQGAVPQKYIHVSKITGRHFPGWV